MQIKLTHKKEFHSSISNGRGHNISVDNNTDLNPIGPSPMELVLMGVAGCSSIGIVRILKQQKIYFNNLEIIVDGKTKNSHPKVFTQIHAKVYVYGDVDSKKIYRAVDLTFKKYCSVSLTFSRSVKMYYYVFLNNKQILN
tara:strand:+ start:1933 stop:2352 length:420 start_codon:yes stop_codon:yes gene_type:complete